MAITTTGKAPKDSTRRTCRFRAASFDFGFLLVRTRRAPSAILKLGICRSFYSHRC